MLGLFLAYRKFIVTGIVVFSSLAFLLLFTENKNVSPVLQGFIVGVACFLLIPILYSKIILEESLNSLGLQSGRFWSGAFSILSGLLLAGGIEIALVISFPIFREQYVLPRLIQMSFLWFIFYEIVLSTIILILYEVFFRGLVQTLWLKAWGVWSVVMQTVLCYTFFFLKDDFSWQKAPILIFCPFAGYIAYRSRSLWYSLTASWIFIFLTDIFFLIYR